MEKIHSRLQIIQYLLPFEDALEYVLPTFFHPHH